MVSGATIFKDRADNGKVKGTTDFRRSTMKGPVQKANGLACFVINMIVPRKVIADPDTREFNAANSFDGLDVHQRDQRAAYEDKGPSW